MVTESQFEDKGYNQDFLAIIIIKKKPNHQMVSLLHVTYFMTP